VILLSEVTLWVAFVLLIDWVALWTASMFFAEKAKPEGTGVVLIVAGLLQFVNAYVIGAVAGDVLTASAVGYFAFALLATGLVLLKKMDLGAIAYMNVAFGVLFACYTVYTAIHALPGITIVNGATALFFFGTSVGIVKGRSKISLVVGIIMALVLLLIGIPMLIGVLAA